MDTKLKKFGYEEILLLIPICIQICSVITRGHRVWGFLFSRPEFRSLLQNDHVLYT